MGGAGGGVEMGDADGEGVGGVGWRSFSEAEKGADHESDLAFVRPTPADDGLFDSLGGVFVDRQAAAGHGEERSAPGGAESDGGAIALDEDDAFECGAIRLMLPDDFENLLVNGDEASGWKESGGVLDHAVGHGAYLGSRFFQDGITGAAEGGVDGQNALAP